VMLVSSIPWVWLRQDLIPFPPGLTSEGMTTFSSSVFSLFILSGIFGFCLVLVFFFFFTSTWGLSSGSYAC
jgi:hypothetical protein